MPKFKEFDVVKSEDGSEWRIIGVNEDAGGFIYDCVPNISGKPNIVAQFRENDIELIH